MNNKVNPFCSKCAEILTDEEREFFDKNDIIGMTGCKYLCKSHWCECMPEATPWRYLTDCGVCGGTVCKTCKCETNMGCVVCSDCYDCLHNGKRI